MITSLFPGSIVRRLLWALVMLAGCGAAWAQAPVITNHPVTQSVAPGGSVTLGVTATGTGTLSYQWSRNGVAVAGATNASYAIANAQLANAGRYSVAVTNASGTVISAPAQVNLSGMLWAVGSDGSGQLGIGTPTQRESPRPIASGVKAVAAGGFHSLYLRNDGTLWSMGRNNQGALGDGTVTWRYSPVQVADGVIAAAAGRFHSLYLKSDGALWAMGNNGTGQLGDGTTTTRLSPVQVAVDVSAVAAGDSHSLYLKVDGTLWATGANSYGQLGDGTTTQRNSPVQVATGVSAVAAGQYHSLYLKGDGTLWAMGSNTTGQLGDGTTTQRNSPVQVAFGVRAVAAGWSHSFILKTDATLWATGDNSVGQLGDGTTTSRFSLVQVAVGVSAVAAGQYHSLFVKTDRTQWVMGDNYYGQLGDGTTIRRNSPQQMAAGVSGVAAGGYHSFSLKSDGSLWAMGDNSYGQLGDGTLTQRNSPVQLVGGLGAPAVGYWHSMFVKSDGTLWATGSNFWGQLGDGTTSQRIFPAQVAVGVSAASAGQYHSMHVKTDGTLWAMGNNNSGQLGDGTSTQRSLPVQVAVGVSAVAAGYTHSLYLRTDGSLWAMGSNNSGQLGDGTTVQRNSPVQVAVGVSAVAAGNVHSLFVKNDGTLWAMGYNGYGTLGDGTTTSRSSPVQIAIGVSAVTAGYLHSLFLKSDGTLWAMGANYSGQLGDGTSTQRNVPVQVANDVSGLAAGADHSLFIKSDGSLWAMGENYYGQLGGGAIGTRFSPVQVASSALVVAAGGSSSYFIQATGVGTVPAMATQPIGGTYMFGNSATLTAAATGSGPLDYRWRKDGVDIAGVHGATLLLPFLQLSDAGSYSVVVTNSAGAVTSASAALTVTPPIPPSITTQPVSQSVAPGGTATLSVVATGTEPLAYQWRREDVTLPGATGSSLVLSNLGSANVGNYTVVITNSAGSVTSTAALLLLTGRPVIATHPVASFVAAGASATLSVTEYNAGVSYQWQRNGSPISGATAATYTISAVSSATVGQYHVIVSNASGATASLSVAVGLDSPFLDESFAPPSFAQKFDPSRTTLLSDGSFLVFFNVDSLLTRRTGGLVRYLADGSIDAGFRYPSTYGRVMAARAIAGKFYAEVAVNRYDQPARLSVVRFNNDGSPDSTWTPLNYEYLSNEYGRAFTVQPDGKVLLAGFYRNFAGTGRQGLVRLNTDGSIDTSFAVLTLAGGSGLWSAPVLDASGRIYIGGDFTAVNGASLPGIARLNANGTLDPGFVPTGFTRNSAVRGIVVQSTGKVVIGGRFSVGSTSYVPFVRLAANGSMDLTFATSSFASSFLSGVRDMKPLPGDKFVGVDYSVYVMNANGGTVASSEFQQPKLLAQGNPSSAFSIEVTADGGYLVCGSFDAVADYNNGPVVPRANVARFSASGVLQPGQVEPMGFVVSPDTFVRMADGRTLVAFGSSGVANTLSGYADLLADGRLASTAYSPVLSDGNTILGFAPLADGRVFVWGDDTGIREFRRFLPDGTVDPSLTATSGATFDAALALPDHRMFIWTKRVTATDILAGETVRRLQVSGSIDAGFALQLYQPAASVVRDAATPADLAANRLGMIKSLKSLNLSVLAIQADGRALVRYLGADGTIKLIRLTAAGAWDPTFQPGSVAALPLAVYYEDVYDSARAEWMYSEINSPGGRDLACAVVQADGRIVVGGEFATYNGIAANGIVRLNPDGTVDGTFAAGAGALWLTPPPGISAARPGVESIVRMGDEKLLVAGTFERFNASDAPGLVRLNADGSVDSSFVAPVSRAASESGMARLRLQPYGSVLLSGPYVVGGEIYPRSLLRLTFPLVAPVVTAPPQSQTVTTGGPVTMTFAASGTAPFTFQWRKGGAAIAGATNSTYTIASAGFADAGSYSVVVSNSAGYAISAAATLTVVPPTPPSITTHPAGATLNVTDVASFGVAATGTAPLSYQWRKDGIAIGGAVKSTLLLGPVAPASAGGYDVVVSNGAGSVTSNPAVLTINPPIAIVTAPAARAGYLGMPLTLAVVANSTVGNLTYQWRKDGVAIAGATGSNFTLPALQPGSAGSYDVMVSSAAGYSATSAGAVLTVSDAAPTFAVQPAGTTVAVGGAVTMTAGVNGSWPLTYQWRRDGLTLSGATGAALSLTNAQAYDQGDYTVVVTNALGVATSAIARINVVPRVVNLSARLVIGPDGAMAVFTVEGAANKTLLLRAVGPGLAPFGLAGLMPDPQLEVFNSAGTLVAVNDNWGAAENAGTVGATSAAVGAFALGVGSRDSAVLRSFAPGTYTVRATAANGAGGVAYLELYDADLAAGSISTIPYVAVRGHVAPGNGVVIGGMGSNTRGQRSYLLRVVGPGLGLPGAASDPSFLVVRDNSLVGANDNWNAVAAEADATAAASTRLGLAPLNAAGKDAALVLTGNIHAGAHTVQVNSPEGSAGMVLVELHDLDASRPASFAPAIVSPPLDQSVAADSPLTVRVLAHGSAPLTYQWLKDGVPVNGATSAVFSVAAAAAAHAGSYAVVVTNAQGSATSLPALVTVQGGPAGNGAAQVVVGGGYVAGGTAVISNTLSYPGAPTSLGWSVALPSGWSYASDAGASGEVKPALGTTGTLEWAWSTVPASPVTFTYSVNVPAGESGAKSIVASAIVREGGNVQIITAFPSPLIVNPVSRYHSADSNLDGRISLIELTRVIELYNTRNGTTRTGCYAVQAGSEDGFAPDSTRASAAVVSFAGYHAADSNRSGSLSLLELTRMIELYNCRSGTTRTGAYHVQPGTEDGFAPGS